MEFSQYQDRLREFTQKKDTEWEIYLDEFRKINPEPVLREVEQKVAVKPNVQINIKFWLALAAGLGALALSAFRVAERFFSVAGGYNEKINGFFSYGEAISAVLAVNVTIFALAIAYAYTTGKMSENSQTWGLGTAITISAVAGLGQAFKGLGADWSGFVSVFDLVLAFVLGVGATALEYFSGDLLGVELVRFNSEKQNAWERYHAEQKQNETEYTEQVQLASSEFTEQHKAWVRLAKQQFGLWMAQFGKWNEQVEKERSVRSNLEPNNRTVRSREGTFSELVRSTMHTAYQENNLVLPFSLLGTKLTEQLAMSGYSEQDATELVRKKKSQISELRTRWMQENNL